MHQVPPTSPRSTTRKDVEPPTAEWGTLSGEAGITGLAGTLALRTGTLALPAKTLGFQDETRAFTATGPGKSGVGAWANQGRRKRRSRW